jgi:hypothetical protein
LPQRWGNFSPEDHPSATVKCRFRRNEVILPSLLETPSLPLIWRTHPCFYFPLSCSVWRTPMMPEARGRLVPLRSAPIFAAET